MVLTAKCEQRRWGGKSTAAHTQVGAWRVPAPWPAFIFRTRLYRDRRKSSRLISFESGPTELDMQTAWRCVGRKKNSSGTMWCSETTCVRFLQLKLWSQPLWFLCILLEQPLGPRCFEETNRAGVPGSEARLHAYLWLRSARHQKLLDFTPHLQTKGQPFLTLPVRHCQKIAKLHNSD